MDDDLESLLRAGIDHHLAGELDEALWCYGTALELDEGNTLILYNLGCVFEEKGDLDSAAKAFALAKMVHDYRGEKDPDVVRAIRDYGKRGVN